MATALRARASTMGSARIPIGSGSRPRPGVQHSQARDAAAARHRHGATICDRALRLGVTSVRIATHCTEADIARQHIERRRKLGMDVVRLPDDGAHDRAGGARRSRRS